MYNTTTQEQQIIDWFQNIWDSHKYDRNTRREITDHIQGDINSNHFEENDLAELGEWVWDDFSELEIVRQDYPQPEINKESVDWEQFGDFLADLLDIEPYEYDDDDDDDW